MVFHTLKTYAYGPTAYNTGITFQKSTALFLWYTVPWTCAGFFPRVGVFSKWEEECKREKNFWPSREIVKTLWHPLGFMYAYSAVSSSSVGRNKFREAKSCQNWNIGVSKARRKRKTVYSICQSLHTNNEWNRERNWNTRTRKARRRRNFFTTFVTVANIQLMKSWAKVKYRC